MIDKQDNGPQNLAIRMKSTLFILAVSTLLVFSPLFVRAQEQRIEFSANLSVDEALATKKREGLHSPTGSLSEKIWFPEKCSSEIEGLKLCVENSTLFVNSGEQVRINLFWVNTSFSDRRIGRRSEGYRVTVADENGKKVIPGFGQTLLERRERMRNSGEEDKGIIFRSFGGSDRGLYVEANGMEKDEIRLTGKMYDYNFGSKGPYHVTVSRRVASLEKTRTIEVVLDDIEVHVR